MAPISKGLRRNTDRGPPLLGADLRDAREELFARMVCDGLALGVAYARAGFPPSRSHSAASTLFALPRVQARAAAILEARRTSNVVSLAEVTDMLKRVFAGAHSEGEYSAAHNAAFSLARLYGHVTDRSTVEVIRRPSRDPDAPSEQALSTWVESLPGSGSLALAGPEGEPPSSLRARAANGRSELEGLEGSNGRSELEGLEGSNGRSELEGSGPRASQGAFRVAPTEAPGRALEARFQNARLINGLAGPEPSTQAVNSGSGLEGPGPEPDFFNVFNDLAGPGPSAGTGVPGRPENGAPATTVTGAPPSGGKSDLLGLKGTRPPGGKKKPSPKSKQVPVLKNGKVKKLKLKPRIPSAKALFG